MSDYVLDTSVAIAWYLPEDFSKDAKTWHSQLLAGKVKLFVPSIHYIEFANVLRTHVKRGVIKADIAREIYMLHLEAPLEIIDSPMDNILEVSLEYSSTTYDAVYINLALNQSAPLLTGERTTTPWVVKLGDLAHVVKFSTWVF